MVKRPAVWLASKPLALWAVGGQVPPQPTGAVQAASKHLATGKNVLAIAFGQPSKDASQSATCYKCRKVDHFAWRCREPGKPTPCVFVQAVHTAAPLDVGDTDDEQDKELGKVKVEHMDESDGTQAKDEEYIKFEMYQNNYYTQGSDSGGLFALTEIPTTEGRV
ncbi:hypothetical protein C0989_003036 [Termitomyces sp. Mn162]|nr:hypothetical protein C0989_003036 [Termitomyces sp. Mn162]